MILADMAEWSNATGLRPVLVGVRGFESHYPHIFI